MGLTTIKMQVSNPANKKRVKEISFLVDSGSVYSFVDRKILKELGIKPETVKEFILADGSIVKRPIGIARFKYKKDVGGAPVVFGETDDENLLGATTLEALGLILDPFKRVVFPSRLTA